MKNIQILDQIKTKYYGEVGTPERDRLENELEAPVSDSRYELPVRN